jgi:O-antigen/teichoic acid export membrane protein
MSGCQSEAAIGRHRGRLLILPLLLVLLLLAPAPAAAQGVVRVYYAGPAGGVHQALELAGFDLADDPAQADVFVLNGAVPDAAALAERLRAGRGLVLILGSGVSAEQAGTLLGAPVTLQVLTETLSLDRAPRAQDRLVEEIVWNSSPQVRGRALVGGVDLDPLVEGYETHELVLGHGQVGRGTVFLFTPFLSDQANPQIQEWPYFNYLIYHLVVRAAGAEPLSFADYPASPVPHAGERTALFLILGVMLAGAAAAFILVRRYSRAHPEALEAIVADREKYAAREAGTAWEEVGFHRPLGGFLLALMFGLVLFIPLIIYQNMILPAWILPSAQALGIWGRVTQFFQVAWWFFDMGTSAAFIKYLSEYRVTDPRKGIMYGQLFVWWQALSGAVQVALVVALSSTVVANSAYAIYSWSIIVHTFIQIPGFYQVIRNALTGLQRFDYAQVLDLALQVFLPNVAQVGIVALMYAWGQAHPAFGGAMGGVLGMGIAAYAAELLTFLLGLWLYRRLGYGTRVLFLAHFDWEVIKNSFRFGVFEMLGSVAWTLGQAAEIWITQVRLINYNEVWGNWGLAQNFIFAFQVMQTLYSNIMPAISEAVSHGRKVLSQYYAAMSYKYGGLISAFVGSALLAVADRFILGASGPEFERAALWSIPLIIWGAIQYPSWVGDNVQLAANRPYLKASLVTGEQVIRVVLAWFLVARFQIYALIIAYFVGLLAKNIIAYWVNHRFCFPQRFYFWQGLIAPLLAGTVHWAVLRWTLGLLWQGDQLSSVLIFFLAILPSFPLFAFFYGLFGGWDDGTLAELRQAVDLSSFMRPLAWVFWKASALGARLSPLHGRFPIGVREAALAEARALTEERVHL